MNDPPPAAHGEPASVRFPAASYCAQWPVPSGPEVVATVAVRAGKVRVPSATEEACSIVAPLVKPGSVIASPALLVIIRFPRACKFVPSKTNVCVLQAPGRGSIVPCKSMRTGAILAQTERYD